MADIYTGQPVDGFSMAQLRHMIFDGVAQAICTDCSEEHEVEPDTDGRDCPSCGGQGTLTSPLRKAGLI
jgi:DnaJ-class molecular chaperone